MQFRLTIAAIIISAALPAAADFRTVALAYEVPLDNFTAPSSLNASAIFRECDTCEPHNVRVTAATDYRINDKSVSLQEFRKRILNIQNRADETVIVIRHLESDTVEQILINL